MKRAPRSRQRHDLYAKYHDYDSEISDLLGECGLILWEGTPMDWAMRQLFQMSKHGFDDAELVATAHIHAAQMLDRLQKEGLYLSDFASDARGLQD